MFCTGRKKLNLLARNEGKIKAHESCLDVRAWSHDIEARGLYTRDWIRSDMPISVVNVRTVSSCLRTMSTQRHRARSTPKCHPNCKSKHILESICKSCHAMKECLKNDENYEKYFVEEEFETSHWPCERCLEALKSIKMFWKLITEKIFKISLPQTKDLESSRDSVQSVAKAWQKELVHQAVIVNNLKPIINTQVIETPTYCWKTYTKYLKKIITLDNFRFIVDDDDAVEDKSLNQEICSFEDKATETDHALPSTIDNRRRPRVLLKKVSKCTSLRIRTMDFGSDACNIDNDKINMYKNNIDYLQQQYNMQNDELRQLKKENTSLKLQIQNMNNNFVPSYSKIIADNSATAIPKPYELYCEQEHKVEDIDSEMVITLKKCENKNFKHVSMLQVLHKSNGKRIINEHFEDKTKYTKKKQDPIKILTKVHKTFGAIVQRELTIANQRKCNPSEIEIDASYERVHGSRSVPSYSTVSTQSMLSSVFVSTTQV